MKTKETLRKPVSNRAAHSKRSRTASAKVSKLATESTSELTPIRLSESRRLLEELLTIIEARIDVGFGNQLFIRGEGPGLSWEKGDLLTCIDEQTWRWMSSGDEPIIFKLLLNDEKWSQGENIEVLPGAKVEIVPVF